LFLLTATTTTMDFLPIGINKYYKVVYHHHHHDQYHHQYHQYHHKYHHYHHHHQYHHYHHHYHHHHHKYHHYHHHHHQYYHYHHHYHHHHHQYHHHHHHHHYYYHHYQYQGYGSCNFQNVNDGKCPVGTKPGYLNGGTRRTLQMLNSNPNAKGNLRKSYAADVNCLVAATHFLPLFFIYNNENDLIRQSITTVYISHKNHDPIYASEFLCRTLYNIMYHNMELEVALDHAAIDTNDDFIKQKLNDAKNKVIEVLDPSSSLSKEALPDDIALTSMARLWDVGKSEPIKVGKASPTEGALPGAIYFSLRYKDSLEEALIANANCGGDSAARGIVIGMLLGAVHGASAIPSRWLEGLRSLNHVKKQINTIRSSIKTDL